MPIASSPMGLAHKVARMTIFVVNEALISGIETVFHSFHGLMNSINWPGSSVWVFIAQLGEYCSANAEATGSNPVEAPKIFQAIFAIA